MTEELSATAAFRMRCRARFQARQVLDNKTVSHLMATAYLLAATFSRAGGRLRHLVNASRRCETRFLQNWCGRMLKPWLAPPAVDIWRRERIGWDRYYSRNFGNIAKETELTSSLLLKAPGPNGEKGVLHCPFEYNWMRLIANTDARKLFEDYYLVGASSWSPTDHAVLANLCGLSDDPIFIGVSHESDAGQYRLFAPGIQAVPIMACDWRSPHDFVPKDHKERSIDILMVSHFEYWKRHWLLFEALGRMRKDLRVVLIGRNAARRKEEDLRAEARAFGAHQDIEIHRNLENDEVGRFQCDAKISVALSKREGACVAVTESFFANTPVAMMADAHVGAKKYINDKTGRLLRRRDMAAILSWMIEHSGDFAARDWATSNISAELSSEKLNDILRRHSLATGRPWTTDITPFCRRYVPRYLNLEDQMRMRPALTRLREVHGIRLKEFVSERQGLSKAS